MRARLLFVCGMAALSCARSDVSASHRGAVRETPAMPARLMLGTTPSDSLVHAWDIDVNPDGVGLPPGSATYAQGAVVFAAKCAGCHGARGEGMAPYPPLVGRDPRDGFPFGKDPKYVKTVGNYWPYATTIFDYVRRAMPQLTPGSLTPDELYGVVAFILAENEIVAKDAIIDARTLPAVKMPARGRFVVDDRKGGPEIK
ncbi:MAG: cytochrome c [Gemmatimonadaceae bacterium]